MTIEIRHAQRTVLLAGDEVALGARAFDVLAYLHDHADRVVTKAELLTHVWSGVMVEDSNLTVQIAGLRKALGAATIKTVPGVGYRFTGIEGPADAGTGANSDGAPDRPAAGNLPALSVPSVPSLAVLPFANLTGRPDSDYLVDGIVNDIINALSRLSSFFVISGTSTFTYKGRTVDLAEVGRELGVRYLLEGSIQQSGDRLRILTQLVEADTARMIWQDRFDGLASDIFDLQDRVAEHVAGALEPRLIWAEAARATAKPTDSLDAYDLCLRATPLIYKMNSLSMLNDGMALLRQALDLDPGYVHAKAVMVYAHTAAFATRWWTVDQARAAIPLAREVMDSNTTDALALAYAGHYLAYLGGRPEEGLTALKNAAALNPNSATIAMLLGWVHIYLDQNEPALEQLRRARRISPLHPEIGVTTTGIGNAMLQTGDAAGAVVWYEQALAEYPEFASAYLGMIGCYHALGRREDSARMARWLLAKVPDMTITTFLRSRPQISKVYVDLMVEALAANGFPD